MRNITKREVEEVIDALLAGRPGGPVRDSLIAAAIRGFQARGVPLVEEPKLPERLVSVREAYCRWTLGPSVESPTVQVTAMHSGLQEWAASICPEIARRWNAKAEVLQVASAMRNAAEQGIYPETSWAFHNLAGRLEAAYREEKP